MLKAHELREIIKLVEESSSIGKFEFEHESTRLVITKKEGAAQPILKSEGSAETTKEVKEVPEVPVQATPPAATTENTQTIVSPMVGTFYSAPEPGAAPFVQVGQQVQEDTIVCVLEAMKLFNEIEAGVKGTIVEVLVKDGQMVEYGQPLFKVGMKDV
ncbi:acetyl-CoA carboxylase biotin carboxyl carrier protein [Ammoniphilus sp. YIM 78166]|uniref:acetyl-CoA carboxylase biotin carboxyl carrier protein n=1 Tax=Ammoniphilus sp. YIM 78166 TaxID=1644106 RepID=UPI0010703186|nr:acetyl-CoA carboxylase biotin carboxyl carrier protein [Ammoniphilus sp. YIM 78166]